MKPKKYNKFVPVKAMKV